MDKSARFCVVGRIRKSFGKCGEVLVEAYTKTSFDVLIGCSVWITPPTHEVHQAIITSAEQSDKGWRIAFNTVDSIGKAKPLAGCSILVDASSCPCEVVDEDREELVPLDGYTMVDKVHGVVGVIEGRIETKANGIWIVNGQYGEVLVPAIDQVVCDIDDIAKTVQVELMPGLIEMNN